MGPSGHTLVGMLGSDHLHKNGGGHGSWGQREELIRVEEHLLDDL